MMAISTQSAVLDPTSIPGNVWPWQRKFDLPQKILEFGYYPDVSRLMPGDLILTCDLNPDWTSRLITRFQARHCHSPEWTHAAMYMGAKGQLVESTFESIIKGEHGVKVGNLADYCMTHRILVRRVPDHALFNDAIGDEAECLRRRWWLVTSAMKHMNRPYGFWQLPHFLRRPANAIRTVVMPKRLVCSTLFETAVIDAVGRVLCSTPVVPGKLAETIDLVTVPMTWVRLEMLPLK